MKRKPGLAGSSAATDRVPRREVVLGLGSPSSARSSVHTAQQSTPYQFLSVAWKCKSVFPDVNETGLRRHSAKANQAACKFDFTHVP